MLKKFIISTLILAHVFITSTSAVTKKALPPEDFMANDIVEQTEEAEKLSIEKMQLAEEYVENKTNKIGIMSYGQKKVHYVANNNIGNRVQGQYNWCGPGTVYNIAEIYDYIKHGTYKSASQATYASPTWLNVEEDNGTNFGPRIANTLNAWVPNNNYVLYEAAVRSTGHADWANKLKNAIIWTIDKDNGWGIKAYSVAVNLNYSGSSVAALYPIHSYYGGRGVAHWVAAYGYDDRSSNSQSLIYITDSNSNMVNEGLSRTYTTTVQNLGYASFARGIVY